MAQQDTIDKIINIQFNYRELVQGWAAASDAIDKAKENLQKFKKEGNSEGVAKQTQLIKALRTEMAAYTREMQANIKEEVKQEGSIEQLRGSIAKLTAAYNKMSREERNAAKGTDLAKKIAGLQTELNEANTALLNFRDNVGNYASAAKGFSPLTFQVQQLAREMPSLTVSLQQFFLAISNNVPMFVDELKRATAANKALRSEGKATIPVFRQVISSIISWQTAIVLIITALTMYGKEIGSWVKSLFSAKEAAISMAGAQERINDALKEDGYGIGEHIAKVKELQIQWKALGDDLNARKQFIVDNKDAFDDLGVKVTNVNDAENILITHTDDFIIALSMRARAAAGMKLAAEAYEKALIEQQKVEEEIKKGYTTQRYVFGGSPNGEDLRSTRPYTKAEQDILMAPVRALEDQAKAYLNISAESQKAASDKLKNAGIEESANDKVADSVRRIITLEELQAKMRANNLKEYTKLLADWRVALGREVSKMESELDKALQKTDSEISGNLRKQLEEQELEYRNRISEAHLIDNDLGAAMEMVNIYKEQIAQIERLEGVYRAAGKTDAEIQAIRIKARMDLQKAEENVANIQIETTHKSLSLAAQTAGNLANVFEQLGGESEKYAAFAKAMAVMQVVLSESVAIAKAWEGNAALPFPANIIATAASVAAIVAAIGSALSSTKSTEVPKYASGGLITGPGTGTSDSIVARVSNGEAIMTAQAVNDWGAVLSAMNVSSGGNAIQGSNLPQRGDGMRCMEQMMERVLLNLPSPIVLVKDIDNGQRLVKVAANLAKLGRKK